jgi:integrase
MRPKKIRTCLVKRRKPKAFENIAFTEVKLRAASARSKEYTINDPKTPGLSLKITPTGRKVFVFRYRSEYSRQRKLNIGRFSDFSVAEARRKARSHWADIYDGGDPASDRISKRHAITVAEFAARYLRDQAKPKLAPSTFREYTSVLETRVLPRIGNLALVEVTRNDVEKLHASMASTPVRANRMLSVLKAMFFKAEDWNAIPRGSNPASRIAMNKERPKQKYFSDAEQVRIFEAIDRLRDEMPKSKHGLDALTLLFYSGCRPGEILNLRWENIDFVAGTARLHNTKTGEARLLLSTIAISFLQSIAPEYHVGWVFPGAVFGDHLKSLTRPWKRICELSELPDACMKDIRHTVGTYVAKEGGLYSAQVILRHTSPKTTMRYAHPFEASVRGDLENAMKQIETNQKRAKHKYRLELLDETGKAK